MSENLHAKHRERVRDEFFARGFSDDTPEHKVLEMLLFYALPRKDTNEIAHLLLNRFGSPSKVFDASPEELMKVNGVGEKTAALIKLMVPVIRMYVNDKLKAKKKFADMDEIGDYLLKKYLGFTKEIVAITSLDNKGCILGFDIIAEGDLDAVTVSTRSVIETAINRKAACIILSHNHPDGDATPSNEDIRTTAKLCQAMRNINIPLLNHFILCDNDYVSLAVSQNYKHLFTV